MQKPSLIVILSELFSILSPYHRFIIKGMVELSILFHGQVVVAQGSVSILTHIAG